MNGTTLYDEDWASYFPVAMKYAGCFIGYVGKNHSSIGNSNVYSYITDRPLNSAKRNKKL